jgi:hypothetical protein
VTIKKRKVDDAMELKDALKKIDDQIDAVSSRMEKKDDAHLFAMSLVEQLRRLTPYQLATVKHKIHGILIEAEFSMPPTPS